MFCCEYWYSKLMQEHTKQDSKLFIWFKEVRMRFILYLLVCFTAFVSLYAQDLILDKKDSVMYGTYTFNNLTLKNNTSIIVAPYEANTEKGKLIIQAKSITICSGSMIIASGKGDGGLSTVGNGGGAGHGGKGGSSIFASNTGGNTYGSIFGNFVDMGSKGNNGATIGGLGGGVIALYCQALTIDGSLVADGLKGLNGGQNSGICGGGGSGGGILLNCQSLFLSNVGGISANGGNGGMGANGDGGGGGGGRVKMFYVKKYILGGVSTDGGSIGNNGQPGFNGTIGYDNYPNTPELISPNKISINKPTFRIVSIDSNTSDKLLYKIEISIDSFKTIYTTYNQTIDQTGWSKLEYASGETGEFISQKVLPPGHYYWRAYAYDGNVWSDGWNWEKPYPTTYGEFSTGTTGVQETNIIEKSFSLAQNYPNPFNPSTNISFELPVSGMVSLKIYNTLGQEVQSLIDRQYQAGSYTVSWEPSSVNGGLPSGVYFYKLQAGKFNEVRKMVYVK